MRDRKHQLLIGWNAMKSGQRSAYRLFNPTIRSVSSFVTSCLFVWLWVSERACVCVHLFDFFLRRSRKVDGSDAATHAHNAHWGHKRKAIKKTWKKLKNLRESLQIAEEIHQESGTLSKDSRRVRPPTNGHKQTTPPPSSFPPQGSSRLPRRICNRNRSTGSWRRPWRIFKD